MIFAVVAGALRLVVGVGWWTVRAAALLGGLVVALAVLAGALLALGVVR